MKAHKSQNPSVWHSYVSRWGVWMWLRFWVPSRTSKRFGHFYRFENQTTTCGYIQGLALAPLMAALWSVPYILMFMVFIVWPMQSMGGGNYLELLLTMASALANIIGVIIVSAILVFLLFLAIDGTTKVYATIQRVWTKLRKYEVPTLDEIAAAKTNVGIEQHSMFQIIMGYIKDRHDRICSIVVIEKSPKETEQ